VRLCVIEQSNRGFQRHLVTILGNAPPAFSLLPFNTVSNQTLRL
jgi:hypothetical protein